MDEENEEKKSESFIVHSLCSSPHYKKCMLAILINER